MVSLSISNTSSSMLSLGENLSERESSLINSSSSRTSTTTTTTSGWATWSSRIPKIPNIQVFQRDQLIIKKRYNALASQIAQLEKEKNSLLNSEARQKQAANSPKITDLTNKINLLKKRLNFWDPVSHAKKGESIKISGICSQDQASGGTSIRSSLAAISSDTSSLSNFSTQSSSSSRDQGDRETKEQASQSVFRTKRKQLSTIAHSSHSDSPLGSEVDDKATKKSRNQSLSTSSNSVVIRKAPSKKAPIVVSSSSSSSSSSDEDSDGDMSNLNSSKKTAAASSSSSSNSALSKAPSKKASIVVSSSSSSSSSSDEDLSDNNLSKKPSGKRRAIVVSSSDDSSSSSSSSNEDSDGDTSNLNSSKRTAAASSSSSSLKTFSYTTVYGTKIEVTCPAGAPEDIKLIIIHDAFMKLDVKKWAKYVVKDFPHRTSEYLVRRISYLRTVDAIEYDGKMYKPLPKKEKLGDGFEPGDEQFVNTYNYIVRKNYNIRFDEIVDEIIKKRPDVGSRKATEDHLLKIMRKATRNASDKDNKYFVCEVDGTKHYLVSSNVLDNMVKLGL